MIVQMMGGAPATEPVPELPVGAHRWGLNNIMMSPRVSPVRFAGWTHWFDLHETAHIQARHKGQINAYPWQCRQTNPIYRWVVDPAMPSSVAYPVAEVRAHFNGTRLFCSTLDWMLALAIQKGCYDRIDLYGWRMSNPFYQHQVGSAQWWIEQALKAGITVTHNSRTALSKPRKFSGEPVMLPEHLMYGLETTDRSKLYHAR